MIEDGRLEWFNGSPSVTLNEDRPVVRQRFTLAHELAHVFLGSGSTKAAFRTAMNTRSQDDERLCDAVAAAILVPRILS